MCPQTNNNNLRRKLNDLKINNYFKNSWPQNSKKNQDKSISSLEKEKHGKSLSE